MIPGFRREPRPLLSFIIRVINRTNREQIRQQLKSFLDHDFQGRSPADQAALDRLGNEPALLNDAADSLIAAMREMADMWIDSGKSPMDPDVDTPQDRNVEDVLPGREYSLFFLIDRAFLRHYPRYTEMMPDGSQQIKSTFPKLDSEMLHGPRSLDEVLKAHGLTWAAFFFTRLLDSPDSRLLSRCDHCLSYFAYKRARLRTVKRGIFCPECEGAGSVKRTLLSRSKRLDTAAKAWLEFEKKRKAPIELERIAVKVNKEHGTAYGRRWVTQNLSEIQSRVEALKNAKG